jgi:hypothetical protein
MSSKNSKRMAAIATMAASLMLMGGAAFASSASVVEGDLGTTGLAPGPVSEAHATARTTVAEGQRQVIRPLPL